MYSPNSANKILKFLAKNPKSSYSEIGLEQNIQRLEQSAISYDLRTLQGDGLVNESEISVPKRNPDVEGDPLVSVKMYRVSPAGAALIKSRANKIFHRYILVASLIISLVAPIVMNEEPALPLIKNETTGAAETMPLDSTRVKPL